jgi:hypothetical protein
MSVKPDSESEPAQKSEQQIDQNHPDPGNRAGGQGECEQEQFAVAQPPLGGEHLLHLRTGALGSSGRREFGHNRADRRFAEI